MNHKISLFIGGICIGVFGVLATQSIILKIPLSVEMLIDLVVGIIFAIPGFARND